MNSILKISEAASLAMHACAILAANADHPLAVGGIASALEASEAHLSKVLQDLSRAGLVHSVRGPKGGFTLARPAVEVTLLDIFEAIEGPFQMGSCISMHRPDFCKGEQCIMGGLVDSVNKQTRDYLATTALSSLAERFADVAAK